MRYQSIQNNSVGPIATSDRSVWDGYSLSGPFHPISALNTSVRNSSKSHVSVFDFALDHFSRSHSAIPGTHLSFLYAA